MNSTLRSGRGPVRMLKHGAEAVGVALFAAMFVVFVLGVGMRYIAATPLIWSDEACLLLMLWSTFWAAAFIVPTSEHVGFDIVYSRASPMQRRAMLIVALGGCGVLFAYAWPATLDYVLFVWRERTPALRLRLDFVFMCFVIFLGAIALRLLWLTGTLFARDWRNRLLP